MVGRRWATALRRAGSWNSATQERLTRSHFDAKLIRNQFFCHIELKIQRFKAQTLYSIHVAASIAMVDCSCL